MQIVPFLAAAVLSAALAAHAPARADANLDQQVAQRLSGDRTGACMAVAVIEGETLRKTFACADPKAPVRIGEDSAFEIGSISKTMTSTLLARAIVRGDASLDDTLASWLPEGTRVPDYKGEPIRLRHLVTHTSGLPALPSRLGATDMADPYANLTPDALLASLGDVTLTRAPGSAFEYSNFGAMVLSLALAERAEVPFDVLLARDLFTPLGMTHSFIKDAPKGVRIARGHAQNAKAVPAWTFATDLAGVGGVHATLDDMVRYARAQIDAPAGELGKAIARTHAELFSPPSIGMNWMSTEVAGRKLLFHEGGTGGFSSFIAFDPVARKAVVVLSDTAWTSLGGLGSLGLHLMNDAVPLGKPRRAEKAPQALLEGLSGRYQLAPALAATLRNDKGTLYIKADGQPEIALDYDSAGDFYPRQLDALLTPQKKRDGSYGFAWSQGGAVMAATRIEAKPDGVPALSAADLEAYVGTYSLMPNFALKVMHKRGKLSAQATGQGAFELTPSGKDRFEAAAFGIEIEFKRGADGAVESLDLHQAGHVLSGKRTP